MGFQIDMNNCNRDAKSNLANLDFPQTQDDERGNSSRNECRFILLHNWWYRRMIKCTAFSPCLWFSARMGILSQRLFRTRSKEM